MRKQTYLCVDLKTYTHDTQMQPMEGRKGTLAMSEDQERFLFIEALPESHRRNPKVYRGQAINVLLNPKGELIITFRRQVLTPETDPFRMAGTIMEDLRLAKEKMGF